MTWKMSNSRQVSPDVTEDEREVQRVNNNGGGNIEQDAGAGVHGHNVQGAAPAGARRDENSISFRHFLQPHSDVVPSPAPTCRGRSRGPQPGSVDLVDMAMALPDFVQDHLVVESLADHQNNGTPSHSGASAVDLNVLNEILPDFATSQPPHNLPAPSRRRNLAEDPVVAPEVHGAAGGSSALPDFLSDGPMQCTDSNAADNNSLLAAASTNRSASRMIPSNSLTERNRITDESSRSTSFDSSDTMRSEVERLRRDLADRNRRITQLEGEVARLRTNIISLESALRSAEQSRLGLQGSHSGAGDSAIPSSSSATVKVNGRLAECNEIDAQTVREIAHSSEDLISQLLQNICRLKGFSDSDQSTFDTQKSSSQGRGKDNV